MKLTSDVSRGGRDELAHARWKSRRLLAVVSLPFGVGETNCSQGFVCQSIGFRSFYEVFHKNTEISGFFSFSFWFSVTFLDNFMHHTTP